MITILSSAWTCYLSWTYLLNILLIRLCQLVTVATSCDQSRSKPRDYKKHVHTYVENESVFLYSTDVTSFCIISVVFLCAIPVQLVYVK